jgi:hypothetical protein
VKFSSYSHWRFHAQSHEASLTRNLTNWYVHTSWFLSESFLTPYLRQNRVLLQEQTAAQAVKKRFSSPRTRIFMLMQNDATSLYPKLHESTLPSPHPSSTRSILILGSHLPYLSKADSSVRYSTKNYIFNFCISHNCYGGTWQRSWLRHYDTSRKVGGSIAHEVIGFFNWPNTFSHIMALGSTQPLTEMSTRNLPAG